MAQRDLPLTREIVLGYQNDNCYTVDLNLEVVGGAKAGISPIHAIVTITENGINILDYQSRNGVYVNGQELYPMRKYELHSGDKLQLGRVTIGVQFILWV